MARIAVTDEVLQSPERAAKLTDYAPFYLSNLHEEGNGVRATLKDEAGETVDTVLISNRTMLRQLEKLTALGTPDDEYGPLIVAKRGSRYQFVAAQNGNGKK